MDGTSVLCSHVAAALADLEQLKAFKLIAKRQQLLARQLRRLEKSTQPCGDAAWKYYLKTAQERETVFLKKLNDVRLFKDALDKGDYSVDGLSPIFQSLLCHILSVTSGAADGSGVRATTNEHQSSNEQQANNEPQASNDRRSTSSSTNIPRDAIGSQGADGSQNAIGSQSADGSQNASGSHVSNGYHQTSRSIGQNFYLDLTSEFPPDFISICEHYKGLLERPDNAFPLLYYGWTKQPLLCQLPHEADAYVLNAIGTKLKNDENFPVAMQPTRSLPLNSTIEGERVLPNDQSSLIPLLLYVRIVLLCMLLGISTMVQLCLCTGIFLYASGALDPVLNFWRQEQFARFRQFWLFRDRRNVSELLAELRIQREVLGASEDPPETVVLISIHNGEAQLPRPSRFEEWVLERPALIPYVMAIDWWLRWLYQSFIMLFCTLNPAYAPLTCLVTGPSLWPTVFLTSRIGPDRLDQLLRNAQSLIDQRMTTAVPWGSPLYVTVTETINEPPRESTTDPFVVDSDASSVLSGWSEDSVFTNN